MRTLDKIAADVELAFAPLPFELAQQVRALRALRHPQDIYYIQCGFGALAGSTGERLLTEVFAGLPSAKTDYQQNLIDEIMEVLT